jgi:hypothetical protein
LDAAGERPECDEHRHSPPFELGRLIIHAVHYIRAGRVAASVWRFGVGSHWWTYIAIPYIPLRSSGSPRYTAIASLREFNQHGPRFAPTLLGPEATRGTGAVFLSARLIAERCRSGTGALSGNAAPHNDTAPSSLSALGRVKHD